MLSRLKRRKLPNHLWIISLELRYFSIPARYSNKTRCKAHGLLVLILSSSSFMTSMCNYISLYTYIYLYICRYILAKPHWTHTQMLNMILRPTVQLFRSRSALQRSSDTTFNSTTLPIGVLPTHSSSNSKPVAPSKLSSILAPQYQERVTSFYK